MKPERPPDLLSRTSLLRLLAVMLLVISPHLLRLPAWESALVLSIAAWRGTAAIRQWPMPHALLKIALTLAIFAGVYASYGRVWGQNAGVALLVVMLALKLTELRERRDVMVTVFLLYFLLVTHFLYSQAPWTVLYLLLSTVAITAVLIDVHHAGHARPLPMTLRLSAQMLLQSLPLMLLMFVLFPRLPGPLWTLPDDAGGARSGLSDTMTPGDIGRLALSEEIAFRVRFNGAVPAPSDRYWRGPLLTEYDGLTWHADRRHAHAPTPDIKLQGPRYDYEITLEATRAHWLFALDMPSLPSLPEGTRLGSDYQWLANEPVRELRRYRFQAQLQYQLQLDLPLALRRLQLAYPVDGNPRAQALARAWRAQSRSDEELVQRALRHFHDEPYSYTLQPGAQRADARSRIDEFLFESRRGYCEHYAGAFTYLMRVAGIPARVVTGYLGGEPNPFGDWYVVGQSDAHAWSEVWLAGQGWVRVDPTSAVAPERIDRSVTTARARRTNSRSAALGTLDWPALRYRVEATWDWVDAQWNGLVLGYGTERQRELLGRIGLGDWQSMLLALTGSVTLLLTVIGIVLMRRAAPAAIDPAVRLWQRGIAPLARHGLRQRPDEGARDFIERAQQQRPELADALTTLLRAYVDLRYEAEPGPDALARLRKASRWSPPRRRPR